jgi:hypothetical protein
MHGVHMCGEEKKGRGEEIFFFRWVENVQNMLVENSFLEASLCTRGG